MMTHKELENYLLQSEINNSIDSNKIIEILGNMIGLGDIIGIAMINLFIRNNNVKLQNVKDYKIKLYKLIEQTEEEKYIIKCNEEMKLEHNKGCRLSFIPYEELKDKCSINYLYCDIFNR